MTTLTIDIIEKLKCHLRAERFFLNIFPDLFYVFSDIKCNVLAKEREFSTYKKYQTLFLSLYSLFFHYHCLIDFDIEGFLLQVTTIIHTSIFLEGS
jgi:hypothetical protein